VKLETGLVHVWYHDGFVEITLSHPNFEKLQVHRKHGVWFRQITRGTKHALQPNISFCKTFSNGKTEICMDLCVSPHCNVSDYV